MSAGDELDQLRIPFEKIKFGKEIEFHGYGSVFQGEVDDQDVALKRLNITNLGHIKPKLLGEILTISRFRQHPNLVALLGFCDENNNEIILVYEYVHDGNVADRMRKRLTTIQRLEICLGAARGIEYLHAGADPITPGIVHGDVKPSKILLNLNSDSKKFEAKVSNFGLSKIRPGNVQENVGPTPAYRDPHYEVTQNVTKESDVYSLGVVLLEVLCGVSELVDTDDYQERHVTELVPKRLQQNKVRKVVHFDIRKEIKTECLETYAKIACQCVMKNPDDRPSMAQVVQQLEEALRLQGGDVPPLPDFGSRSIVEDDQKEDENVSKVSEDNLGPNKKPIDQKTDDLDHNEKLDINEEDKDEGVINGAGISSGSNGDVIMEREVSSLPHFARRSIVEDDKKEDENVSKVSENDFKLNNKPVEQEVSDTDINKEDKDEDDTKRVDISLRSNNDDTVKEQSSCLSNSSSEDEDAQKENGNVEDVVVMIENDDESIQESNITHVENAQKENENDLEEAGKIQVEDVVVKIENDNERMEESDKTHVEDANKNVDEVVVIENNKESDNNYCVEDAQKNDDVVTKRNNDSDKTDKNDPDKSMDNLRSIKITEEFDTENKPEVIVVARDGGVRGFVSNTKLKPIEKTEDIKIKRNNSTSSESSDGDNTTPSDSLLRKSPTLDSSSEKTTSCCSMCVSWKRFVFDSVKMLQNCFVRRAILE